MYCSLSSLSLSLSQNPAPRYFPKIPNHGSTPKSENSCSKIKHGSAPPPMTILKPGDDDNTQGVEGIKEKIEVEVVAAEVEGMVIGVALIQGFCFFCKNLLSSVGLLIEETYHSKEDHQTPHGCYYLMIPPLLNDNWLTGHIPPELGKLTDLFDLNVANNHLNGPSPDNLSSCTNLNSLNVYGNKLNGTIPPAFEMLESMTYLNLSSNNLRGPIPVELSRIGNLDTLDISNNRLTGSIPSSLGDLEHLLKLNLSKNNLVGFIPAEFGNLRSVMDIDLSNNQLSSQIPPELGQLQNLLLLNSRSHSAARALVSILQ